MSIVRERHHLIGHGLVQRKVVLSTQHLNRRGRVLARIRYGDADVLRGEEGMIEIHFGEEVRSCRTEMMLLPAPDLGKQRREAAELLALDINSL